MKLFQTPLFPLVENGNYISIKKSYEDAGADLWLLEQAYHQLRDDYQSVERDHEGIERQGGIFLRGVSILVAVLIGLGNFSLSALEKDSPWTLISWIAYLVILILIGISIITTSRVFTRVPRFALAHESLANFESSKEKYLLRLIVTLINVIQSNYIINNWKSTMLRRGLIYLQFGIAIFVFYGLGFGLFQVFSIFSF